MENQKLIKFIEGKIKHKSTRKDDKWRLEDCLATLNKGKLLDPTQMGFINSLKKEQKERSTKYIKNHALKKLGV